MVLLIVSTALVTMGAVASVALTFLLGARGRELTASETAPTGDAMKPFLAWGMFYVNPDDPRGWVPKMNGLGTTPNFRTRSAAAMLLTAVLCALAGAIGIVVSLLLLRMQFASN